MSRYSKEPPSVLKIILERGTYEMTTGGAKKKLKVATTLELLDKKSSSNDNI